MAGLRVIRGPDWKWSDQDDGPGHVGTVTGKGSNAGWVSIVWDSGRRNEYRAGKDGCCDLAVIDNGPAGVKHAGAQCDSCDENGIRGIRWKCADCDDYDLCTECYGNDRHDREHKFYRIDTPSSDRVDVGKRSNAVKLQARGVYKGSKVMRGPDWEKGNQDGGAGSIGVVTKVGYVRENGMDKAACVVEWPHDSDSKAYIYRFGLGGKVDIKFKSAAIGWGYYKDHLPALRDPEKLAKKTKDSDDHDDDDGDTLAKLLTVGLLAGGDLGAALLLAAVASAGKGRKAETEKRFSVGDKVRVDSDLSKVKDLQDGHGGFNILMIPFLGKVGKVEEIDDDGDVKVNFQFVDFTYNPGALTKVQEAGAECASPRSIPAKVTTISSNEKTDFKPGDEVIIFEDIETVKNLQRGHGGWNEAMATLIKNKTVGRVKSVDEDNDLTVQFDGKSFMLNPVICSTARVKSAVRRLNSTDVPMNQKDSNSGGASGASRSNAGASTRFKIGDKVRLDKDMDFVKRMQKGHGGWAEDMKKAMLEDGTVKEIDKDGDLKVKFSKTTWVLNPDVCYAPRPETARKDLNRDYGQRPTSAMDTSRYRCPICKERMKDMIYQCGHGTCEECSNTINQCFDCKVKITNRIKMQMQ